MQGGDQFVPGWIDQAGPLYLQRARGSIAIVWGDCVLEAIKEAGKDREGQLIGFLSR
jgi:hypothetical protein